MASGLTVAPMRLSKPVRALLYGGGAALLTLYATIYCAEMHNVAEIEVSYFRTLRWLLAAGILLVSGAIGCFRADKERRFWPDTVFLSVVGFGTLLVGLLIFFEYGGSYITFDASGQFAANVCLLTVVALAVACEVRGAVLAFSAASVSRTLRRTAKGVCLTVALAMLVLLAAGRLLNFV